MDHFFHMLLLVFVSSWQDTAVLFAEKHVSVSTYVLNNWSEMTWFYIISSSIQLQTKLNTTKSLLIKMIMLLRWLFPYDMNADSSFRLTLKGRPNRPIHNPQRGACSPFFTIFFFSPSLTNQDCFCDKQSPLIMSLFFLNYNEEL